MRCKNNLLQTTLAFRLDMLATHAAETAINASMPRRPCTPPFFPMAARPAQLGMTRIVGHSGIRTCLVIPVRDPAEAQSEPVNCPGPPQESLRYGLSGLRDLARTNCENRTNTGRALGFLNHVTRQYQS